MMIPQRSLGIVIAVLAATLLGGLGFWLGRTTQSDTNTTSVLHGTVALVSIDSSGFFVEADGATVARSYPVPSLWIDKQGTVHEDGPPACLAPLSKGQHVTYGVVHITPTQGAPGADLAIWVRREVD